jgi:hypothetical protein
MLVSDPARSSSLATDAVNVNARSAAADITAASATTTTGNPQRRIIAPARHFSNASASPSPSGKRLFFWGFTSHLPR